MDTNDTVKGYLEKLPPAPRGVESWIYKEVIENAYLIYDQKNEKAVCTRCGRKIPLKKILPVKHNEAGRCPICGAKATCKAVHYGRKKLTEYFRILIFTHRGKTVYGTLFEITAEFEPFGRPRLSKWLSALYVFTDKEQHYYKCHPGWYIYSERWKEVKNIRVPYPPHGMNYCMAKFEKTELYEENLKNVFTKSCLKYHYDPDFFDYYEITSYEMIEYVSKSLKYPAIELLRKAGFWQIVIDYVSGRGLKSAIYINGSDLRRILRLPKRWFRKVCGLELGLGELSVFRRLSEPLKEKCSTELLRRYRHAEYYRKEIEPFVPFEKALLYVVGQNADMYTYRDYLECAYLTGEDLSRKKNLYPENLVTAHDRVTAMRKIQKDKGMEIGMSRTVEMLKETFPEYRKDGLMIRAAENQQELNRESQALAHCVRTYGERMAKRKTYIFFIRKIEEPNTPYYTLELSPKKEMMQCKGDHNCEMTEEVKAFVDGWLKFIKKKSTKEAT